MYIHTHTHKLSLCSFKDAKDKEKIHSVANKEKWNTNSSISIFQSTQQWKKPFKIFENHFQPRIHYRIILSVKSEGKTCIFKHAKFSTMYPVWELNRKENQNQNQPPQPKEEGESSPLCWRKEVSGPGESWGRRLRFLGTRRKGRWKGLSKTV